MNYPITLETKRLLIRPLTPEDTGDWLQFMQDPAALRYFPMLDPVNARANAEDWMQRSFTRYREQRYGMEALILKETGEFIGQCGLLLQDLDQRIELEVGYSLLPRHWGKGYASEAARAFRDFAFKNNLSDSLVSIIHCDNIPSQHVAERNGMHREKKTKCVWNISPPPGQEQERPATTVELEVFVYRIFREAWESLMHE